MPTSRRRRVRAWTTAAFAFIVVVGLLLLTGLGAWLTGLVPLGDARVPDEVLPAIGAEADPQVAGRDDPGEPAASLPLAEVDVRGPLVVRTVRWPDGEPIADADLVLSGAQGQERHRGAPLGRTILRPASAAYPLDLVVSAPGYEERRVFVEEPGEVLLRLPELDGYVVQLVNPLGTPLPDARVHAWVHWPPRPAYLGGEGHGLVAWQAQQPLATSTPDADGWVRIELAEDVSSAADLVYVAVGADLATALHRRRLPLVVREQAGATLRSMKPLLVSLADEHGAAVEGVRVELSSGPGVPDVFETHGVTDARGEVRLPRSLGESFVRVVHEAYDLHAAFADGRAVALREGVAQVGGFEQQVVGQLLARQRVVGTVVDALSGSGLADVRATVQTRDGEVIATGRSKADGVLDLVVPGHHDDSLEIVLQAVGAVRHRELLPRRGLAEPQRWFIKREPGDAWVLRGQVVDDEFGGVPATLTIWSTTNLTAARDTIPYARHPDWREVWSDTLDNDGVFRAPIAAANELHVLTADWIDAAGGWHRARVGPSDPREWLETTLRVRLARSHTVDVIVRNTGPAAWKVVESTWVPWGRAPRRDAFEPRAAEEPVSRPLPFEGWTEFQLVQPRLPVDLVMDAASMDATDGTLVLDTPRPDCPIVLVRGDVPVCWHELDVAVLGGKSDPRRPESLGLRDVWAHAEAGRTMQVCLPETSSKEWVIVLLYQPRSDGSVDVHWRWHGKASEIPQVWPPSHLPTPGPTWNVPAFDPAAWR